MTTKVDPKPNSASSPVEAEVRGLVDAVQGVPEVPVDKRNAVQGLAGDLLRQEAQTSGLNLEAFVAAGVALRKSCDRPETPVRTANACPSEWFEQVGIRGRERIDEQLENLHFDRVGEVGCNIDKCCAAIRDVVAAAETAVCGIIAPVKRTLELVMCMGFKQLVLPAVELAIEALARARDATADRNCVIAQCLEEIGRCVDGAAQGGPRAGVEFGGAERNRDAVQQGQVGTQAASAEGGPVAGSSGGAGTRLASGEVGVPGMKVQYDFGVNGSVRANLNANVDLGGFKPCLMLGAFGALGAAAALGALECLSASIECPGDSASPPQPAPAPAPTPAPQPAPAPAPTPQPTSTPTGEGVIAPPPELAQVEEPAPPPKKLAALQAAAAEPPAAPQVAQGATPAPAVGSTQASTQASTQGSAAHDPWAVKKTGEW